MTRDRRFLLGVVAAVAVAGWARAGDEPPVRVTVVVVLASGDHNKVDPKLAALAKEVKKKKETEKLTGFLVEATLQHSIPVGESHTFKLLDGQTMKVTVSSAKDKAGRIGLTVDAPGLGEITYTCVCDKFVPVITPHVTKKGEQLLVAILAKPCTGK